MATHGKDDAVEGSWSPKRPRTAAEQRAAAPTSTDPGALAADIERTREELAETLDAIADKVSPKRVAKRTTKKVGDSVKEGAGKAEEALKTGAAAAVETVRDAAETVKEKVSPSEPVPVVPVVPAPHVLPQETVSLPPYRPYTPPPASKLPVYAGAVAALAVVLLVLRRRRR